MGSLSVYIPFTSSSLIVSNFALCGMPFLAGFYSKDFILEMFSMRYVNIFGFVLRFHVFYVVVSFIRTTTYIKCISRTL
jgi:NADH-ubiquinone oxidoreductase chain 5